jgi:hypothetical protein
VIPTHLKPRSQSKPTLKRFALALLSLEILGSPSPMGWHWGFSKVG